MYPQASVSTCSALNPAAPPFIPYPPQDPNTLSNQGLASTRPPSHTKDLLAVRLQASHAEHKARQQQYQQAPEPDWQSPPAIEEGAYTRGHTVGYEVRDAREIRGVRGNRETSEESNARFCRDARALEAEAQAYFEMDAEIAAEGEEERLQMYRDPEPYRQPRYGRRFEAHIQLEGRPRGNTISPLYYNNINLIYISQPTLQLILNGSVI